MAEIKDMISNKFLPTNTTSATTRNIDGNFLDLFESALFIAKYVFGG